MPIVAEEQKGHTDHQFIEPASDSTKGQISLSFTWLRLARFAGFRQQLIEANLWLQSMRTKGS